MAGAEGGARGTMNEGANEGAVVMTGCFGGDDIDDGDGDGGDSMASSKTRRRRCVRLSAEWVEPETEPSEGPSSSSSSSSLSSAEPKIGADASEAQAQAGAAGAGADTDGEDNTSSSSGSDGEAASATDEEEGRCKRGDGSDTCNVPPNDDPAPKLSARSLPIRLDDGVAGAFRLRVGSPPTDDDYEGDDSGGGDGDSGSLGHVTTYVPPLSEHGREVADSVRALRRELQKQDRAGAAAAAHDNEAYAEHVATLADLAVSLGLAHMNAMVEIEEALEQHQAHDFADRGGRDRVNDAALLELERSYGALRAALDLYQIAKEDATVHHGNEIPLNGGADSTDESDNGVTAGGSRSGTAAAEASVMLHMAELALRRSLPPDGTPDYGTALSHCREARALCRTELARWEEEEEEVRRRNDHDQEEYEAMIGTLELGLADAALRVGTVLINMYEEGLIDLALGDDDAPPNIVPDGRQQQQQQQREAFGEREESVLLEARDAFESSASMYRRALDGSKERRNRSAAAYATTATHTAEELDDTTNLADALHNVGVACLYLTDLPRAIDVWEESFEIFSGLTERARTGRGGLRQEEEGFALIMAETLQSLSDANLQSGRFGEASDRFGRAMRMYADLDKRGVDSRAGMKQPPRLQSAFDSDEAIDLHLEALEQYRQSLSGDLPPELLENGDLGGGGYLEPDDLYEADLLVTLGSIHLSREEADEASEYLTKAIELYEGGTDEDDPALADALLNFAFAQLYLGKYDEAARVYDRAIDIYREAVGEGNNPFTFGDDDGMATSGLMGGGAKTRTRGATDDDGGGGGGIQKRLIDIDAYQSGIKNETTNLVGAL